MFASVADIILVASRESLEEEQDLKVKELYLEYRVDFISKAISGWYLGFTEGLISA
jgi:uncharacterized protein (DUF2164 family)